MTGELNLSVPQTRGAEQAFYPSILERSQRSETAFLVAIATMYVQGVSTRRVTKVLEEACGTSISSSTVSNAAKKLDAELSRWRSRPLAETEYLLLDARYEKVRVDGVSRSCAVLVAIGVLPSGKRSILGLSVALSEAEVHWRDFLRSLKERGMHGLKMVTSDDHEGLNAALKSTLPGIPWQRCQFHLQQNAGAYVTRKEDRPVLAEEVRAVFDAGNADAAKQKLDALVSKYHDSNNRLAQWLEDSIVEGLIVFALPTKHRRRMRTTNMVERLNKELRRRTRVVGIFPNEDSLLRLASAIAMEISDEWEAAKCYLSMTDD
jgi:transposase-like protein